MQRRETIRKLLIWSGILSTIWYTAMNIIVPSMPGGYDWTSQTVSELSAIGVSTRPLWIKMTVLYALLTALFGVGIWISANGNRSLKISGILMILYAVVGLVWPPMHERAVIAAGSRSTTDTMHIVFTFISVLLMLLIIILAATSLGKIFLFYSIVTIIALLAFGGLTGVDARQLEKNLPTPWMGIWERVSIGVYMAWVVMLAIVLLKYKRNDVQVHS